MSNLYNVIKTGTIKKGIKDFTSQVSIMSRIL